MKVSLDDATASYQGEWPRDCKCVHCNEKAILAFTVIEDSGIDEYLCDRMPDEFSGSGVWFHDATAWATYICRSCFKATTHWNQA